MKTPHAATFRSWLMCLAGLASLLASSPTMASECLALNDGETYNVLSSVLSFHRSEYSNAGPLIKIFEVGGGDPAMNGAFIYVAIEHNGLAYVWKTGLNVRGIRKMRYGQNNSIALDVTEDVMDDKMSIVNRKATYKITFFIKDGALQNRLQIE